MDVSTAGVADLGGTLLVEATVLTSSLSSLDPLSPGIVGVGSQSGEVLPLEVAEPLAQSTLTIVASTSTGATSPVLPGEGCGDLPSSPLEAPGTEVEE